MGQEKEVCKLDEELQSDKLDAIFCVAGGWAGGNAANKGFSLLYHSDIQCQR